MKLCLVLAVLFSLLCLPAGAQTQLTGMTICLDPGHTSETSEGTASRDGKLTERHLNWVIAVRLRELLLKHGASVVMTKHREGEIVTNRKRAEMANAAHADLFLRLHCDSGAPGGLGTYYPDRQGHAHSVTGPSFEIIRASHAAAQAFHPATIRALGGALADRGIMGDSQTFVGGKQGALTGSIFTHVPALTIEMCVLTNAHDYALLRTPVGQERMATALLYGVYAYKQHLSGIR